MSSARKKAKGGAGAAGIGKGKGKGKGKDTNSHSPSLSHSLPPSSSSLSSPSLSLSSSSSSSSSPSPSSSSLSSNSPSSHTLPSLSSPSSSSSSSSSKLLSSDSPSHTKSQNDENMLRKSPSHFPSIPPSSLSSPSSPSLPLPLPFLPSPSPPPFSLSVPLTLPMCYRALSLLSSGPLGVEFSLRSVGISGQLKGMEILESLLYPQAAAASSLSSSPSPSSSSPSSSLSMFSDLNEDPPPPLRLLSYINVLDLSDNSITHFPNHFPIMQQLNTLMVHNNPLHSIFPSLPLHSHSPSIPPSLFSSLSFSLPSLRDVGLHSCLISNISDIIPLSFLPQLEMISLLGNPIQSVTHYRNKILKLFHINQNNPHPPIISPFSSSFPPFNSPLSIIVNRCKIRILDFQKFSHKEIAKTTKFPLKKLFSSDKNKIKEKDIKNNKRGRDQGGEEGKQEKMEEESKHISIPPPPSSSLPHSLSSLPISTLMSLLETSNLKEDLDALEIELERREMEGSGNGNGSNIMGMDVGIREEKEPEKEKEKGNDHHSYPHHLPVSSFPSLPIEEKRQEQEDTEMEVAEVEKASESEIPSDPKKKKSKTSGRKSKRS